MLSDQDAYPACPEPLAKLGINSVEGSLPKGYVKLFCLMKGDSK